MAARLVACPSCSQHIKIDETQCPLCGARLRAESGMIGRTASAVLLGLSMTACPGDDSTADSGASNSDSNTMGMTGGDSTGGSASGASMSGSVDDSTTFIGEPEYGVGDTTFAETTGGGSDSTSASAGDSSSSSGAAESTTGTTGDTSSSTGFSASEPEYGVPLTDSASDTGIITTGVEPEYGVPEPDYGVPE